MTDSSTEGIKTVLPSARVADPGDRFAARSGFDPRTLTTQHRWFGISPAASRRGARWKSWPTAS
jgi:hypothetical protein